jgi:23S rRNA (cytosine1962-C5)-methyltransferase
MPTLHLKPGRERSLERRHPWIFSGAIARLEGEPSPGDTVDVRAANGAFLGRAAYSPHSQIRARLWTVEDRPVDADFLRQRIRTALALRRLTGEPSGPGALRLIYAESDGLPGLIVDRYAGVLVLQSLTAGSEKWKATIADLLTESTGLKDIYERSDSDVRELEGLTPIRGPLRGAPPARITIEEHGLRFDVDLAAGHKTGFYLDQRLNRGRVRGLAQDRDVLDCFCYTGGFTANVLRGGARSVTALDSSAEALRGTRAHLELNGLAAQRCTLIEGDVFQRLRRFRDERLSFDLVILDPPKFAPTAAQASKAARGYKDINLLAFKLLRPGGLLVTFSCSGGVDAALFQKIVASAALDAGVRAQILEHLSQAPDHPVALEFPEAAYLKGLVCAVSA